MMMDHVMTFTDDSRGLISGWQADLQLWFGVFKANMTGNNEDMWDSIYDYTMRMSANEQAGLEGAWNRTLLRFIANRGDLKKTASETWELMHKAQGEWLAKMSASLGTWSTNQATAMYNHGRAMMNAVWQGFQEIWNAFVSWAGGLSMPWSNWQLPSWLQRHSPSELEQALMGTAKAIGDIQRASNQNTMFNGQMAAQTAGDVYNITIPQQFAPNADVGMARQGAQQGINDSVLAARRRRGR